MNLFRSLIYLVSTLILLAVPASSWAESKPDGAELYKKFCSACHRNPASLVEYENLVSNLRQPIGSMPMFPPERLSDDQIRTIIDHIARAKTAAK